MPSEIITYKNKPILKLTKENSHTKLFIGIKKARLILDELESIKSFVLANKEVEGPINSPSEPLTATIMQ